MTIWEIILILGYTSLAIELIFFHVPSVASTVQLTDKKAILVKENTTIAQIKKYSLIKKIILLYLPVVLNNLVFLYPLYLLFSKNEYFLLFDKNIFTHILGTLLIVFGRCFTFYSVFKIRINNSQKQNDFSLHQTGIFAISRNPLLIGMYFFILGVWFLYPNIILAIGILFYFGYMHFKVLLEEDFLLHLFKSEFISYKNKTRRYL